jgi:hypothetical protein
LFAYAKDLFVEASHASLNGSVTATTIRSSRQSLGLQPFVLVCVPALAGLDEGTFTEGHELDRKTEKQAPKAAHRRGNREVGKLIRAANIKPE